MAVGAVSRWLTAGSLVAALAMAACGAATPGKSAKGQSSSSVTTSAAAELTIPYTVSAFLAPGKTMTAEGFSAFGDLDNQTTPPAGPYTLSAGGTNVTFNFPATHSTSLDSLAVPYGSPSPNLTVTPGHYKYLYILSGVAGGPVPANVVLQYSGNSTTSVAAGFDDWCTVETNATPVANSYPAWQGPELINPSNGAAQKVSSNGYTGSEDGCGLYVTRVPVDPSKTLQDVQIQNTMTTLPAGFPSLSTWPPAAHSGRINIIAITAQ